MIVKHLDGDDETEIARTRFDEMPVTKKPCSSSLKRNGSSASDVVAASAADNSASEAGGSVVLSPTGQVSV